MKKQGVCSRCMRLAVIAVMLALAGSATVVAQTPFGAIVGTVYDASGLPVSGAEVEVTNEGTNASYNVKTNQSGDYLVPALPVGLYRVTGRAQGFKAKVVQGVVLEVAARPRVDLRLEVGQLAEQVTVSASTPLVQSETANVGTVIDNKKIVDLPLNGRRATSLAYLVPGVSRGVFGMPSGSGARSTANDIIVDGATNSRFSTNQPVGNPLEYEGPSVDTVEEFKIQLNTFTAENGRGVTAINMVTKSGTNALHGSIYEFLRNDKLDARSFFDTSKLPFRFNQFGVAGGGPVLIPRLYDGRNRTFFFASYEGIRYRQTLNAFANVPTPAMLAGDFSAVATPVRDPLTSEPFPENRIPQNRFSQFTGTFNTYIPAPNRVPDARGNIQTSVANRTNAGSYSARLDHHFTDKDLVFGRYFEATNVTRNQAYAPLFGRLLDIFGKSFVLNYNRTISTRLLDRKSVV